MMPQCGIRGAMGHSMESWYRAVKCAVMHKCSVDRAIRMRVGMWLELWFGSAAEKAENGGDLSACTCKPCVHQHVHQ